MASKQHIKDLLLKYADGNMSRQAFNELMVHLKEKENDLYTEAAVDELWNKMGDIEEVDREEAYKRLVAHKNFKKIKTVRLWTRLTAAVAVLLVLATGIWLVKSRYEVKDSLANLNQPILPGKDRALLTLANGKVIDLTSAVKDKPQRFGNVLISKNKEGNLVYSLAAKEPVVGEAITYNTISTPRGGQIQVNLPDGTKVWLNAASSIKIRSTFTYSGTREVQLDGEAYFEVAHDRNIPFIVKSKNQVVEVLGTHFNINAYADEMETKTTLLQGSVKVNNTRLTPGKQAIINNGNTIVTEANLDMEMAWKNGEFNFEGQDFRTLMRAISRWYDVDVVYEYDVPKNLKIGAQISRNRNLSEILKSLELTREVKFKVEGRRITVIK